MPRFIDRSEFVDYVLTNLGDGVIDVEVTDKQINYIIDDVIKLFQAKHHDGSGKGVLVFPRDRETFEYVLPDRVLSVDEVMHGRYTFVYKSSSGGASDEYLLFGRNTLSLRMGGADGQVITPYVIAEQYYNTLMHQMVPVPSFEFSPVTHRIKFLSPHDRRNTFSLIDGVYLLCKIGYTPDEYPDFYDHPWVKEYTIAKVGIQWGINLSKFGNIKTVGGGTVDGPSIKSYYSEEKTKLDSELDWSGDAPVMLVM